VKVDVISASAGTGKTWRLSRDVTEALLSGAARPEGVVAITYTTKAAGELESRIRSVLLEKGRADLAGRVRDGYIGTVHSVCQRLLREFALETGLSPYLEPIPDSQRQRLFDESLSQVLLGRQEPIAPVARRLSLDDWSPVVRQIVDAARENELGRARILASRDRSRDSFLALLPKVAISAEDYGRKLKAEVEHVARELSARADEEDTAAARGRAEIATILRTAIRRQGLPSWADQLSALKLGETKKIQPVVGRLVSLVDQHLEAEAFQTDVSAFVEAVFDVAADALDTFDRVKRAARVIDFADMLALAAETLRNPEVEGALRSRLDLVLVDEFQDTSPMQLQVVMRIGALARQSIWVGDRKQAIFSFQGSDPELMSRAMDHAAGSGKRDILSKSYRSRPGLVSFTSEVFAAAMARHGYVREEVALTTEKTDPTEMATQPVLETWAWEPRKAEVGNRTISATEAHASAAGVAELLESGLLVRDRLTEATRPVGRRDVAVLARKNDQCQAIASALRERGIPALVALGGLMQTPEAVLARAALSLLSDPEDGVAALEVSYLSGTASTGPDAWMTRRLESVRAWREEREKAKKGGTQSPRLGLPFEDDPRVAALRQLRNLARQLSPSEAFDQAIRAVDLLSLCRTWPDPAQRLANIEAVRAEARAYEDLCRVRRSACTVAGLVEHLHAIQGEKDSDRQAVASDEDAVVVSTWHGAKGLEWPVVVLASLGDPPGRDPFNLHVEAAAKFDPADPLRDRWLRYWPWPYGNRSSGNRLEPLVTASPEGLRVADREEREQLRLLYVGFTRARDLLVLLAQDHPKNGPKIGALAGLADAERRPVVTIPFSTVVGPSEVLAGKSRWPCIVRRPSGLPPTVTASTEGARRWYDAGQRVERPPEILNPSSEPLRVAASARIVGVDPLAGRVELQVTSEMMGPLGDAIHGFLAADPGGEPVARRAIASRLLDAFGVASATDPGSLLQASDALRAYLERRFPGATWRREWPVRARLTERGQPRLLRGEVDLFLELPDGFVLLDHKSFPGGEKERDARALGYAVQLALYARSLEQALGKPLRATFVHLPVRGEVLELDLEPLLAELRRLVSR